MKEHPLITHTFKSHILKLFAQAKATIHYNINCCSVIGDAKILLLTVIFCLSLPFCNVHDWSDHVYGSTVWQFWTTIRFRTLSKTRRRRGLSGQVAMRLHSILFDFQLVEALENFIFLLSICKKLTS